MKKLLIGSIFALFLCVGASAQTVTGSLSPAKRGSSTRGSVKLVIPGGIHVNSNRPNSKYAIATSVRLTADGAKASAVTYPRGRNRKFQFSEDTLNVYEGTVTFPFTVNVPANFRGSTLRVRAVVRFQACTDEVCYQPATKEVTLTATVK